MIPTKAQMLAAFRERHGEALQTAFSGAVVAVCGLGGLGSNIAIALARAGVGKLILIDFDRVDITNLHRQQYKAAQIGQCKTDALCENLREISPYIELVAHTVALDEHNAAALLREADIVCEAFDKAESKAALANLVLETMPDKTLVAASGMAGFGSPNAIRTRKITDRFYLCGDGVSEVRQADGLFAPRVMLCAAHQAQTVLRILGGEANV